MRARLAASLVALGVAWSGVVHARVPTCLTVNGAREGTGLDALVRSELARHSSHYFVERECEARLRVELIVIDAEMGGGRYLTGWLDGEVPHRVSVTDAGIAAAVEELLTVVLHNDPRRLRGPEDRRDVFATGMRALRVSGRTHFGFEAYELGAWVGGRPQMLGGIGGFVRREVGAVHLAVRFGGAHAFGDRRELALKSQVRAELEGALFSSARADTAAFAAVVLGYELQRFEGPVTSDGAEARASADVSGFSAGVRVGVELFRVTELRATGFAQLLLPTFVSSDENGVVDQWTPTAALGAGVVF